jgi:hypothetical protein
MHEERGDRSRMYALGASRFDPLLPTDPRTAMQPKFAEIERIYPQWVTWRHLSRAAKLQNQPSVAAVSTTQSASR